jgi:hypothetical protein
LFSANASVASLFSLALVSSTPWLPPQLHFPCVAVQFPLRLVICSVIFISFVCIHNLSFVIVSGHLTCTEASIYKPSRFLQISWKSRHVSHPCNRIDFTIELKILSLVLNEISRDFQTFYSGLKAPFALDILFHTSSILPPSFVIILPR